jgi:hypothetical protein
MLKDGLLIQKLSVYGEVVSTFEKEKNQRIIISLKPQCIEIDLTDLKDTHLGDVLQINASIIIHKIDNVMRNHIAFPIMEERN